jgi:hypothetical protein
MTASSGKWMVRFKIVRTSILIAVLGLLFGLTVHRPARTVIWIVAGLLVAWFYIAYEAKLKRFERMLKQVEAGDRAASPTTRVDFQLAMLRSQARSFVNFAVMGAVIVVASIPVSFLYSAGKRAGIFAGMVAVGALLVLFGLTLSKRLRAGPIARLSARSQSPDIMPRVGDDTPPNGERI